MLEIIVHFIDIVNFELGWCSLSLGKLFVALSLLLPLVLTGEACLFLSSWSVVASEC
jgi:hypothetical protein